MLLSLRTSPSHLIIKVEISLCIFSIHVNRIFNFLIHILHLQLLPETEDRSTAATGFI